MEAKNVDLLTLVLTKTLTDSVPDELRTELFAKALHGYLFAPDRDGATPLSNAFKLSLEECTRDLTRKFLEDPEIKEQLELAIAEAFTACLAEGKLVESIKKKMSDNLWRLF